jgi:hypothetical protein
MFRFLELGRSKVHSKLKKDGNAFRLLYLEPADDYHAEVRCELRQVNLDKRPVYKALSYAWGDPSLTLPIFINGKTHHVTANCHAALLRLRETGERCMWIDAICINQEDDKEKSTQVALMRDIYHFADEVIVWLGRAQAERSPNDEQDEKKVMAMINTFRLEPFNDGASFLRYALPFGRDVGWGSWTKLNELFKHHWFSRLWAHQEYTVALKARALLQYHSEPFDKIAGCASRLQTALALENWEESMGGLPWPSDLSESVLGVVHRISPRNEYDRGQRQLRDTGLFQLMSLTHRCKCLDPRDRVFAVIGLTACAGSVGDGDGQINYSQSLSQVYTRITWIIISQYQSLQPLCFGKSENLESTQTAEFPSWIFDWRKTREAFFQKQYSASLKTALKVSFDSSSLILRTYGVKVDKISLTYQFDYVEDSLKNEIFYSIVDWLPQAEGLALWTRHFIVYPGGSDPTDAWIRTITADLIRVNGKYCRMDDETLQRLKTIFEIDKSSAVGGHHVGEVLRRDSKAEALNQLLTAYRDRRNAIDSAWDHETLQMLKQLHETYEIRDGHHKQDSISVDDRDSRWEQWEATLRIVEAIRRTMMGRKFFLSSSGYMGLGPLALQEGDMICILLGCDVPLLIRKEGDYYRLVGECFVWGLMDGEALKDRKADEKYEVIRLR